MRQSNGKDLTKEAEPVLSVVEEGERLRAERLRKGNLRMKKDIHLEKERHSARREGEDSMKSVSILFSGKAALPTSGGGGEESMAQGIEGGADIETTRRGFPHPERGQAGPGGERRIRQPRGGRIGKKNRKVAIKREGVPQGVGRRIPKGQENGDLDARAVSKGGPGIDQETFKGKEGRMRKEEKKKGRRGPGEKKGNLREVLLGRKEGKNPRKRKNDVHLHLSLEEEEETERDHGGTEGDSRRPSTNNTSHLSFAGGQKGK